jgi:hypothetical protein
VHHREVPVEDDHVVVDRLRLLQAGGPVGGQVDGERVTPQAADDHVRQLLVVLDHQHPHVSDASAGDADLTLC